MCRGILPIVGCRITEVERPKSPLRSIAMTPRFDLLRRRTKNREIRRVSRIGKRVVLDLDSGDRLVIEPRMTGMVLLGQPPNESHIRLIFRLSGGTAEQFIFWDRRGLGVVQLLSPADFEKKIGPAQIGPDALQITSAELRSGLGKSRRAIKVALLDQKRIAGIGNIYASEILHRCGIHPGESCHRLRAKDWQAMQIAIREVLTEAIRDQGTSLGDGTYGIAGGELGKFHNKLRVYRRDGKECMQCGKPKIVRLIQAQRSTYFCANCQRKRG
jgi:formamidopyrimidine-DNA glycosylase